MKLKAFYTLTDLVTLTASSRRRVVTMLKHSGIPTEMVGGRNVVFLSDIEAKQPKLWASIQLLARAHAVGRALED